MPPLVPGIGLALGLAACALGMGWWAAQMGWLRGEAMEWLVVLLVTGLWNVAVLVAVLTLWQRLSWRAILRARLAYDLRELCLLGEGHNQTRMMGLIHELNRLGAAPTVLEGARLAGADLGGADLRRCNLRLAVLAGADLQGALLDGADLSGADLTGADLSRASLKGANLERADLEDGQMVKVEVTGANLRRANLINVNLYGTSLRTTRLERARFAHRHAGEWESEVHASVEDWIRERLDDEGAYLPHERESRDTASSK